MCLSPLTIPQTVFGPAVKLRAHKDVTLMVMNKQNSEADLAKITSFFFHLIFLDSKFKVF